MNGNNELGTYSSLDFNSQEVVESTRHLDDNTSQQLPVLRSTAQRFRYYNPSEPQPRVTTSAVKRQPFDGFDKDGSSDESSESIEVGRGQKLSAKNTPSKLSGSNMSPQAYLSINNDSLYELTTTPPISRPAARKSDGLERSSLRRDAQVRRASSLQQQEADAGFARSKKLSPIKNNTFERRRSRLTDLHAKVSAEDETSFMEEPHPPTVTLTARNTRFGSQQFHQSTGSDPGIASARYTTGPSVVPSATPQRAQRPHLGTPRSAPNVTQQSFMLPDLPNLTELMSGVYKDGTPVFSRATKSRSRFASAGNPRQPQNTAPHHLPIDSAPVPEDEKAIFASLQLLKEKVAQLEQDKAEAERRVEDYESENIELKAELQARDEQRRSDSALGASDDDGKTRGGLQAEKTKLEATVQSLQNRLDRTQRKVSVSEITMKRITEERDGLVTQLGVAFYNAEELKGEKETLQKENEALRDEVDSLRSENEALAQENSEIRRDAGKSERAIIAENQHLKEQLTNIRTQHEEETQQVHFREAEVRRKSEKKAQAEHAKLQTENTELKTRLEETNAHRDEELRRWNVKEKDMRSQIQRLDETTRQIQVMSFGQASEDLRRENEKLKAQLARGKSLGRKDSGVTTDEGAQLHQQLAELMARHEEESFRWARKETRLRTKIERLEERRSSNEQRAESASHREEQGVTKDTQTLGSRSSPSKLRANGKPTVVSAQEEKSRKSRAASAALHERNRSDERLRSRSKSRSTADIAASLKHDRRASAPLLSTTHQTDANFNDNESTTDLDLSHLNTHNTAYMHGANGVKAPVVKPIIEPPTQDLTFLSFMDPKSIADIRKKLEEEHIANRRAARLAIQNPAQQNNTVRSATSASNPLPRKSSLKDLTGNVTGDVACTTRQLANEIADSTHHTSRSVLSEINRRRRSAPTEMTSAFILPDITMHVPPTTDANGRPTLSAAAQDLLNGLSPHDAANCTICHRITSASLPAGKPAPPEPTVPTPVPVTDRSNVDPDATMRPAQSPAEALAMVLKEMVDELSHLKLELLATTKALKAHDPATGRRKREGIQKRIDDLNEEIRKRSSHIYRLMDVLEGQKAAGQLLHTQSKLDDAARADGDEAEEDEVRREVEETLMSVGVEPAEAKERARKGSGRRVVVQSFHEQSSEESGSDEELPWEGVSSSSGSVMSGRLRY